MSVADEMEFRAQAAGDVTNRWVVGVYYALTSSWDFLWALASPQTPTSYRKHQHHPGCRFGNGGIRCGTAPLPAVWPKWARQTS